ncbi:sensor histidine kinase [Ihubacter sp. rT4E-8]|uniref:sensor histidine kinase n=1 Tax=Ihubacter sp. rT4E-8 TaxID=3242369 RepID=UPI003CF184B4
MKREKSLSRRLSVRLFLQMIATVFLFTFGSVAAYMILLMVFGMFVWQGDEPIYVLGLWVRARQDILGLLYLMAGYIFIVYHYWSKPFHYLQDVIDASKIISSQDDRLAELSPALSDLETQLNQIKVTTLASQRAAKEAEQRKSDLVTYLAHDLKTPITSVIGYLTLLRDEQDISADMRKRYQNIALDKAERLDDLINEFFEITRFNLSHIELNRQQINLTLMLQQLISEFAPMLQEKGLSVSLSAPEGIVLKCDPDKLQRVFDNLLRNAVNYSYENTAIQITASPEGDHILLVFENNGDTISEEKLSRLFEQFYRLDTSRGTRCGGAGLGLAIAKEIVELHGGTIKALSADDIIRFEIYLPS